MADEVNAKIKSINMQLSKTTKSTDVYVPVDATELNPVSTLYVQRWFSKGAKHLAITLEVKGAQT